MQIMSATARVRQGADRRAGYRIANFDQLSVLARAYPGAMTVAPERTLSVRHVRRVSAALYSELLDCWVAVSNAGGAVGFVPPVGPRDVAPRLGAHVSRVAAGADVLVVLCDGERLAGFAILQLSSEPLRAHYATVQRVQVHPDLHGRGLGRALMLGVHDVARSLGLEMLRLSVRGGTGLEHFYASLGYREFGRMPGAIRVAPGHEVDDILCYVRL